MSTVADVVSTIDRFAPFRSAYAGDSVGLQFGYGSSTVTKAVVSLDRSSSAIARCLEIGAELLVCHHPLIYRPLETITEEDNNGKAVLDLVSHGVAYIAAHTNWDCAKGGVNDTLASRLGLLNVQPFGDSGPSNETKLVVFVPSDAAQKVIDALNEAGAGQIGDYSRCAYLVEGEGTFVPGDSSNPHIGSRGARNSVRETRVEMVVPNDLVSKAIRALKSVHPYEEAAFDLYPLADRKPWPIARVGDLAQAIPLEDLVRLADQSLEARSLAWGNSSAMIARVGVCGGSGADLWRSAQAAGADALITGECPQHLALEAADSNFPIVSSGHYATENPGAQALCQKLAKEVADIEWEFFDPRAGDGGRPLFV